jgi:uncharacterized membrane protein
MGKIDKIKEQIGWLKVVFALLVAICVSLVGYLTTTYKTLDNISLVGTIISIITVLFAIIVVNKKAFNKIDELEDL